MMFLPLVLVGATAMRDASWFDTISFPSAEGIEEKPSFRERFAKSEREYAKAWWWCGSGRPCKRRSRARSRTPYSDRARSELSARQRRSQSPSPERLRRIHAAEERMYSRSPSGSRQIINLGPSASSHRPRRSSRRPSRLGSGFDDMSSDSSPSSPVPRLPSYAPSGSYSCFDYGRSYDRKIDEEVKRSKQKRREELARSRGRTMSRMPSYRRSSARSPRRSSPSPSIDPGMSRSGVYDIMSMLQRRQRQPVVQSSQREGGPPPRLPGENI